jgi:hypothetical protein
VHGIVDINFGFSRVVGDCGWIDLFQHNHLATLGSNWVVLLAARLFPAEVFAESFVTKVLGGSSGNIATKNLIRSSFPGDAAFAAGCMNWEDVGLSRPSLRATSITAPAYRSSH